MSSSPQGIHDTLFANELALPPLEFRLPNSCLVDLDFDDCTLLDFLKRKVAAHPRDLLSHARRILVARRQNNVDETFGALLDLFVATGANGLNLRQRLLTRCFAMLDTEKASFLQAGLAAGLSANVSWPGAASVLADGAISDRKAVSKFVQSKN